MTGKAGTQRLHRQHQRRWVPAFAGMTAASLARAGVRGRIAKNDRESPGSAQQHLQHRHADGDAIAHLA
ncbi:hypothetical protein, partial [Pseudoxanthomonas mexicana]|uniref:hypothetical protein n=1 Tax=Pseudoxanthomonas mexicana TaxID=128785 RepID=UPI0028ABEF95